MLRRLIFLFLIVYPVSVSAQGMVNLKMFKLSSNEKVSIGDFPRGKFWVQREQKKVYLAAENWIKGFVIKDDILLPVDDATFEGEGISVNTWKTDVFKKAGESEKKTQTTLLPKYLWSLSLKEIQVTGISTDVNEEYLFVTDKNGNINVLNIVDKSLEGKLNFYKKPIKYFRPLTNGGMIIIYEDNMFYYIERFKIPIFSFLQDLKSSYVVKKSIKMPISFVSSVSINSKEDRVVIAGDHKTLMILNLPGLETKKITEDRLFIEFADFIDDESILFMTLKERGYSDDAFPAHAHFSRLANYFDLRRRVILSPNGRFLLRINDNDSFSVFDLYNSSLLANINLDIRRLGEIIFGMDNKTIIFLERNRERVIIYKLVEKNQ